MGKPMKGRLSIDFKDGGYVKISNQSSHACVEVFNRHLYEYRLSNIKKAVFQQYPKKDHESILLVVDGVEVGRLEE